MSYRYPAARSAAVKGREDLQPLAEQSVDLGWGQPVTDPLQPRRVAGVVQPGEPVVQGGEPDPGLGGLTFGVLVAVDTQPGVVGEVGAELEEERTEVGVEAVQVQYR
jgi:hypothetical protein